MATPIISECTKKFVADHINDSPEKLLLKYKGADNDFDLDMALAQLKGRQKCRLKLSSFLKFDDFIFPDFIAPEQASDQLVAHFHALLVGSGNKVLDMTAGLGIDSLSIAMAGNSVTALDLEPLRTRALAHNASVVGAPLLNAVNGNSVDFIKNTDHSFDVIFIDPARRGDLNKRVYSFADCLPNVVEIIDIMLTRAPRILIKGSPLLDLKGAAAELPVTDIYVVGAHGECKEVLLDIRRDTPLRSYNFVEINNDGTYGSLSFTPAELEEKGAPYLSEGQITPGGYLYEPSAPLMKFTGYGAICRRFPGLYKLSPNTSLYYSDSLLPDFQGRICRIDAIIGSREMKSLKGGAYNVAVRNYNMTAEQLRKKLAVREGQDKFIYGVKVTAKEKPTLLACTRV